jgi:membrane-bound lytic murein transglycosylase B
MRLLKIISVGFFLTTSVLAQSNTPNNDIENFKKELVSQFQFKATEVDHALRNAHYNDRIIQAMNKPYEDKSYHDYRQLFLTPKRIAEGKAFYEANETYLNQVAKQYGVSPEIIVAIIGVESNYGARTTQFSTLDSLYTLAFHYPKRAKFFRYELTQFLLLCRELGKSPESVYGSYAGALGIPQFMPSNYRHYALTTTPDHKPNLFNEPKDAMISIGNYLHHFGWIENQTPAVQLTTNSTHPASEYGKTYTLAELKQQGFTPAKDIGDKSTGTLLQIDANTSTPTSWFGTANFEVIKKYNKSSLYALAVTELAAAIKG